MGKNQKNRRNGRRKYNDRRKDRKAVQGWKDSANNESLHMCMHPKSRILNDEPNVSVVGGVAGMNKPSNHKSSESAKNEIKRTASFVANKGKKRTLEQLERNVALKHPRGMPSSMGKSNCRRQRSNEPMIRRRPLISSFIKDTIHDYLCPDQRSKRRKTDEQSRKSDDRIHENIAKKLDIQKKPAVAKIPNNTNKQKNENIEKQRKQQNTSQKQGNFAKPSNTTKIQSLKEANSSNSSYTNSIKSTSQNGDWSASFEIPMRSINDHLRSSSKSKISSCDHHKPIKTTKEHDQKCCFTPSIQDDFKQAALKKKSAAKTPNIPSPKCLEPITLYLNNDNIEQTYVKCGSETLTTNIEICPLPTQKVKSQEHNETMKCMVFAESNHAKTESTYREDVSIASETRSSLTKETNGSKHEIKNGNLSSSTNDMSIDRQKKLARDKPKLDEETKVAVELPYIGQPKVVPNTQIASCKITIQTSIPEPLQNSEGRYKSSETEHLEEKRKPRESFETPKKVTSKSQSNEGCPRKLAKSTGWSHQATIDENDTRDVIRPSVCKLNTSLYSSMLVCNSTERVDSNLSELKCLIKTSSSKQNELEPDFNASRLMRLEGVNQLKEKSHNQKVGEDETSSLDPLCVPSTQSEVSQDVNPTNKKMDIGAAQTASPRQPNTREDTFRDLYDNLNETDKQPQIDEDRLLQKSNEIGNTTIIQNDRSSFGVITTITPSKGVISDLDGACLSQKSQQSCSHPAIQHADHVEKSVAPEKSQVELLSQTSLRESRCGKTRHSISPQLQEVIIPPDASTTKLMYNYHYASFQEKQASNLLNSCVDQTVKGYDGPFEPNKFSSTVFHMLLDSIGHEIGKTSDSKHSNLIRQISKEKRPTQTPDSVRDFIIDVIKQTNGSEVTLKFLRLTARTFRLVCHSLLLAYKPLAGDIDTKSKRSKSKQEKKSEIMKRSLLSLIICLRPLLARLMEKIHFPDEANKICGIRRFFIANRSPSEAEILLLDIVPLLTNMDREHGTLGSKRSIALLKHLVKLEKSFAALETNDHYEIIKMDSINGVMELFMRQLLYQEGKNSGLIKELQHCQRKLSLKGISSCTLPSITDSCKMVIDRIVSHRKSFLKEFVKSSSPKPKDQKKPVKVTPGTISSTSECYPSEDSIWYDQKSEIEKMKYNELRIDGCIYISTILDILRSMPRSYVETEEEKVKEAKRNKLSRTVYFLFHILWENDPFPEGSLHAKSLHRRENLKSAGKFS